MPRNVSTALECMMDLAVIAITLIASVLCISVVQQNQLLLAGMLVGSFFVSNIAESELRWLPRLHI